MSLVRALKAIEGIWTAEFPDVPWQGQALRLSVDPTGPGLRFHLLFGNLSVLPKVRLHTHDGRMLDSGSVWSVPEEGEEGVGLEIDAALQGDLLHIELIQDIESAQPCPVVALQSLDESGTRIVIYNSLDRLDALRHAWTSSLTAWRTPWAAALQESLEHVIQGRLGEATQRIQRFLQGVPVQTSWESILMRARPLLDLKDALEDTQPDPVDHRHEAEHESAMGATEVQAADPVLLRKLVDQAKGLDRALKRLVCELAAAGRLDEAVAQLERLSPAQLQEQGAGPLMIYANHLMGRYGRANTMLDRLVGLDMSRQMHIDNCPSESQIVARWTKPESQGVSVVCTTYNHARFIGMALAGVFSQMTSHPFEVVVRNDCSTDATADVLQVWQRKYPKLLRVITTPSNTYSKGVPAMPQAINLARYPLVAMCEGDDFWSDTRKLERQAALLNENPQWSAVTHNHYELNEFSGSLSNGRAEKNSGLLPRVQLLLSQPVLWVHTVMFRRDRLRLPSYTHLDDVLGDQIFTTMLGIGGPVYYIGDLLGSVARRNLASTFTPLSEADKLRKRLTTRIYLARLLAECGEHQLSAQLAQWCDNFKRRHCVETAALDVA